MAKWIYLFDEGGQAEEYVGDWEGIRGLFGGRGVYFAEMSCIGLPVPPGFIISTQACNAYLTAGEMFPEGMWEQILEALSYIEANTGKRFGDPRDPLLVSVRSDARVPMPGIMDTVLNLGLNDTTVQGLIKQSGDKRFAYDSYRRFVQMYGDVVLGLKPQEKDGLDPFEVILDAKKEKKSVELDVQDLKELVAEFKVEIKERLDVDFPEDPQEQLRGAIGAAFWSWNTERAISYRRIESIPDDWGTAVNVQAIVFGNMGDTSATGVAFTRNPNTGEKELCGEYLINAQGEDVIAGIRLPKPISQIRDEMPNVYKDLELMGHRLEQYCRDVQDFEFVIERGMLWFLANRTARRTGYAGLRFAIDFLDENLISQTEAIFRVQPDHLGEIFAPNVPPDLNKLPIARGLNASPGGASGMAVFDADTAETLGSAGKKVILIRQEVMPYDVHGLHQSEGVITSRGGYTSHAALVGRRLGKPCVVAGAIQIDYANEGFSALQGRQ